MISLRFAARHCALVSIFATSAFSSAQTTPATIEQKLDAEYTVSKAAADKSDIVTAGSVLVLKKDGLVMSATTGTKAQDVYKDGRIATTGAVGAATKVPSWMKSHVPGSDVKTRTFVAGEKFFVTSIAVSPDGVVMELLSDPFSDVRYITNLKFPFAKGSIPSVEQVDATVAEVIKVQSDDTATDAKPGAPAPSAQATAAPPAPMAAIPPPPPPVDSAPAPTKTIKLKQTREQVVAAFGEPTSIRDLGVKKVYIYPDMKVTFVNNKVTDIQ